MTNDPYLSEIHQTLPRLLALFDVDSTSASFGMGDRYRWAWGLSDFGNGTFQGAAHGIARLWRHGLWPFPTPFSKLLVRMDAMFVATRNLTRSDGSLEEALPFEGSYCVTALVAFDLLCALELMGPDIDDATHIRWREIVRPLIGYLLKADETHAFISNHLATAVAALVRWHKLSDDAQAAEKAHELLRRIIDNQSPEGWFKEYEGADPGYQSLCTYYLADVHQQRPDWNLLEPLRKSIRFLWHFAHPDGSFGGGYGSRCTRFYYPAGLEALALEIPEAASLAAYMLDSIKNQKVVTLSAMDESNLVPMFNAYCLASTGLKLRNDSSEAFPPVPAETVIGRVDFPDAGLLIDGGKQHYTVISTHKGGVVMHFLNGKCVVNNSGVVVRNPLGELGSSQIHNESNQVSWNENELTIDAKIYAMPKNLPTPIQFIILRILCVTAFRVTFVREWIKQLLVRILITKKHPWNASNSRCITLGPDLRITDRPLLSSKYKCVQQPGPFLAIHMASQGYWQIQDEEGETL